MPINSEVPWKFGCTIEESQYDPAPNSSPIYGWDYELPNFKDGVNFALFYFPIPKRNTPLFSYQGQIIQIKMTINLPYSKNVKNFSAWGYAFSRDSNGELLSVKQAVINEQEKQGAKGKRGAYVYNLYPRQENRLKHLVMNTLTGSDQEKSEALREVISNNYRTLTGDTTKELLTLTASGEYQNSATAEAPLGPISLGGSSGYTISAGSEYVKSSEHMIEKEVVTNALNDLEQTLGVVHRHQTSFNTSVERTEHVLSAVGIGTAGYSFYSEKAIEDDYIAPGRDLLITYLVPDSVSTLYFDAQLSVELDIPNSVFLPRSGGFVLDMDAIREEESLKQQMIDEFADEFYDAYENLPIEENPPDSNGIGDSDESADTGRNLPEHIGSLPIRPFSNITTSSRKISRLAELRTEVKRRFLDHKNNIDRRHAEKITLIRENQRLTAKLNERIDQLNKISKDALVKKNSNLERKGKTKKNKKEMSTD